MSRLIAVDLRRLAMILAVAATLVLAFAGVAWAALDPGVSDPAAPADVPSTVHITVAVAGDVLPHTPIVSSARLKAGGYDFSPIFKPIAPYLAAADYTVANLETRLAGASRGFSGYPVFNSPDEVATALSRAGVDAAATANNHSMDKGWAGITRTLDVLQAAGLAQVGTNRTPLERRLPLVVNVGGVWLGFLNYTAETNGIPVPKDQPYAVDLLDPAAVAADAAGARAMGADVVIALIHYGVEYQRQPSEALRTVSRRILENGVDAIVGSHPHVASPIERIVVPDGGGTVAKYVAYSTGNFVSNQTWRYSNCGIVVYLDIEKTDGKARVSGVRYLPVYVQRGSSGGRTAYRVLPDVPGIDPGSDLPLTGTDKAKMLQVWDDARALIDRPADGITAVQVGQFAPGR